MSAKSTCWDKTHRISKSERQKRYRLKLKHDALVAYSGSPPTCIDCGCTNESTLEFDHENGNGNKHRSSIFGYGHNSPGGWNFYLWLKNAGYPKDLNLKVRCTSCHDLKHPDRIAKERRGAPAQSHKDTYVETRSVPF